MAIKNRNRAMVQVLDWKSGGSKILPLPQDNFLRRVSLHGKVKISSGNAAGTGIKNGGLLNLVKRMQIRLNGHDSIFDVDLRTYFKALIFEYGCKPFIDNFTIPAANNNDTFEFEIPIDFALIRNLISDYGALIPAHLLDSVEIIVDFGTIADLLTTANDTVVTDAESEIALSIIEVYSTTGGKELDDILNNLTKVYEGVEQTEIGSAHHSYPADELPVQVRPVPARHLSAVIVPLNNITDDNPIEDIAVIDQIKIENVKGGGEAIFHEFFARLQRQQKLDYRLESDNIDAVYMDYTDLRNGSLNNVDVDAIKYKFLTAAPTANKFNAIRIYKKYIPVTA